MAGDGGEKSRDWKKFKWIGRGDFREYQHRMTPLGIDGRLNLFVARAKYRGHCYHGKYVFDAPYGGYISGDGKEHELGSNCEILYTPANSVKWVATTGSNIPEWAVAAGTDANKGEITYVGKAQHYGGPEAIGRIVKSDGLCYYPYGGKEYHTGNYEVLVLTENGRKLTSPAAIL